MVDGGGGARDSAKTFRRECARCSCRDRRFLVFHDRRLSIFPPVVETVTPGVRLYLTNGVKYRRLTYVNAINELNIYASARAFPR